MDARAVPRAAIEAAFETACRDELDALKPGNVHRHQAGHHMTVAMFEAAAAAAAGPIADPTLSIGARILKATEASFRATGVNTNLGIVLLCAPLAKAAAEIDIGTGLRRRLAILLGILDKTDARDAFAAIRLANPAGLGTVEKGDVSHDGPDMTLIEAMLLAASRDRIANAYVTAYEEVFDFSLPHLLEYLGETDDRAIATSRLHMRLLAEFPDSHIARKFGTDAASQVREEARRILADCGPFAAPQTRLELLEFDRQLKSQGLNPGTTADFVVATLFTATISGRKRA